MTSTKPTKTRVISDQVGEPPERTWSNCLVIGDQVFVAGMTARGNEFDDVASGEAYDQAMAIFRKIQLLMEQAGGNVDDVGLFVARDIDRDQDTIDRLDGAVGCRNVRYCNVWIGDIGFVVNQLGAFRAEGDPFKQRRYFVERVDFCCRFGPR